MSEICFAHMPFARLGHPSMALSVLAGECRQHGIDALVLYGSLKLAKCCSLKNYLEFVQYMPCFTLIGELLFKPYAGYKDDYSADDYFEYARLQMKNSGQCDSLLMRLYLPIANWETRLQKHFWKNFVMRNNLKSARNLKRKVFICARGSVRDTAILISVFRNHLCRCWIVQGNRTYDDGKFYDDTDEICYRSDRGKSNKREMPDCRLRSLR